MQQPGTNLPPPFLASVRASAHPALMAFGDIETLDRGDGVPLAYERQIGAAPSFIWLGGFLSDMAGTKAAALADWAQARGQRFVRFDYSGHGRSGGAFEAQTIGRWKADALAILDGLTEGPAVLVGSSMGAWIALLAAQARPERVKGLLLIAPAADFTERLLWPSIGPEGRAAVEADGRWERPSEDGGTHVYTRRLFEEARAHLVLDRPIPFAGAVRILQGQADAVVPAAHALLLAETMQADDLSVRLVESGDHRLSRPEDIALLLETADQLALSNA